MSKKTTASLGFGVLIAAFVLGVISILGLVPALRERSVLLHFPALIISVYLAGVALVMIKGLVILPDSRQGKDTE